MNKMEGGIINLYTNWLYVKFMLIGIDLTWVKPGKNGGTEFYIRNLLDGILEIKNNDSYILYVANDNYLTFENYLKDNRFSFVKCNMNANDLAKRVVWKNLFLYGKMKKSKIDLAFFPVYDMPLTKCNAFPTVTVVQDIQAFHFPEYFSKIENIVYNISWKLVVRHATEILTTSEFVKKDLQKNFKCKNNISTINIPIVIDKTVVPFEKIEKKYEINDNDYYYTVSSLLPHKNLKTVIRMMNKIIKENINLPHKLLVSGVGGKQKEELEQYIKNNKLENNIILTGFIDNDERNALMKYSRCFLFPSIFEGFGMPPIEAMILGANVLTTKKTSLEEVTKNKCYYVEDPFDIDEWIRKLIEIKDIEKKQIAFPEYNKENIANQYLLLFNEVIKRT